MNDKQVRVVAGDDEDLEYYVRECGEILGVGSKLAPDRRTAKHILEHILFQVAEFRKLNQVRDKTFTIFVEYCPVFELAMSLLKEGDKDLGAGYYGEEEERTGIYPGI